MISLKDNNSLVRKIGFLFVLAILLTDTNVFYSQNNRRERVILIDNMVEGDW